MAVGLERAHPQVLGDGQRLAEVPLGARNVKRCHLECDLSARSASPSKPRS